MLDLYFVRVQRLISIKFKLAVALVFMEFLHILLQGGVSK